MLLFIYLWTFVFWDHRTTHWGPWKPMQPLSAPKSDLLFLPYLFHLKCNHHFVCFSANGKGGLISRHWPNR